MNTEELFYPEIFVAIGEYVFRKGISIGVYSSKKSYFDWSKISFTEQFQDKIVIKKMDVARVSLGYNNVFHDVFQGFVSSEYNSGSGADEIILKDRMIDLERTFIMNTFVDATPQEILTYALSLAGITEYKLDSTLYSAKKIFSVRKKNVIELINQVNADWNIDNDFFFKNGTFYWGENEKQELIYEFEYGVNIISLSRTSGMWQLETVSAPFIRHSEKIKVLHPKITGYFEVLKVKFETNYLGFVRTTIYF